VNAQSEFARIAGEEGSAALITVIAGGELGRKLLVRPDGATEGGLGGPDLDAAAIGAAEELMWAERCEQREVAGRIHEVGA
jgi:xanthine dehydrogenase accessory factor